MAVLHHWVMRRVSTFSYELGGLCDQGHVGKSRIYDASSRALGLPTTAEPGSP